MSISYTVVWRLTYEGMPHCECIERKCIRPLWQLQTQIIVTVYPSALVVTIIA